MKILIDNHIVNMCNTKMNRCLRNIDTIIPLTDNKTTFLVLHLTRFPEAEIHWRKNSRDIMNEKKKRFL